MIDSKERPDIAEPTHSTDPTENAETAEPIEPTDRTDPTDPTESIEFFEQTESIDPSDRIGPFGSVQRLSHAGDLAMTDNLGGPGRRQCWLPRSLPGSLWVVPTQSGRMANRRRGSLAGQSSPPRKPSSERCGTSDSSTEHRRIWA